MVRPTIASMSRKPKKGYFVRGQFVAEGSELDLELKRELKGTDEASKTDLKRESTELQELGEALLDAARRPVRRARPRRKAARRHRRSQAHHQLRGQAPPDAVHRQADARRSTPTRCEAVRDALDEQNRGPAPRRPPSLHEAERWRDRLIADDDALRRLDRDPSRHRRAAAARPGPPGPQGHQGRPARRGAAPGPGLPRDLPDRARAARRAWRRRPCGRGRRAIARGGRMSDSIRPRAHRHRLDQRPRLQRRLRGQGPARAAGLAAAAR